MTNENSTPFPILKTQRLILRDLRSSDAIQLFALRSDDNVNKYLGRKPSKSIDDAETFIKEINENVQTKSSFYWAITLEESDQLIGTICLFDFSIDNSKAEIGYELLPAYHGKGIMQEALAKVIEFGNLHIGLTTIEAFSHFENHSSKKLLEKLNFKKCGGCGGDLIKFKLTSNGFETA